MSEKDKALCAGCRNDFYNGQNPYGIPECWSFKDARVVTRYRLPWWSPTHPKNCTEVTTLSCHSEPGRFAFLEKLPPAWRDDE